MSILTAEYDFATAIAVKQEEAYASGLATGREEGISFGMERGFVAGREEGISFGMERGAYQSKLETAKALLAEGLVPAMVARCTDLPLETVQELMEN